MRRLPIMNTNPKVDQYIQELDNPMKELWAEIRAIVLDVDPKMEEDIKWGAPTFIYKGNLATFNPRAKKFVNLTFHTGAVIGDPDGVLEGDAKKARVFRVGTSEELVAKKAGLENVVRNWIELKDQ
jgi:hypothetical protein